MSEATLRFHAEVLEGTDNWHVAAVAVPRAGFSSPVLLTQSDVSGVITLNVYEANSSVAVFTTTFSKTSTQAGGTEAIHAPLVDGRWGLNTIGHNFVYYIRQADLGVGLLKGGRRYTFVYSIPTAVDGNVIVIWDWDIHPTH